MHLTSRAYSFECHTTTDSIEFGVPYPVHEQLFELIGYQDKHRGEKHQGIFGSAPGIGYETGRGVGRTSMGYTINLGFFHPNQLQDLGELLRLLNYVVPKDCRLDEPQLIELTIHTNDRPSIGGYMHPDLFEWCNESLQWGSQASEQIKQISAKYWQVWRNDQIGTELPPLKPDSFDCTAFNNCLCLGRNGGNIGATVSLQGNNAKIAQHNIETLKPIMLVLVQLSLIESYYRYGY